MKPLPQVDKVFSLVAQEESQRNVRQLQQQVVSNHSMALNNNTGSYGLKQLVTNNLLLNSGNRFNSRERPFCTHCQLQGHTKDRCYKLHGNPIGYKSKNRVNNVFVEGYVAPHGEDLNSVIKGLSSTQCQQLLSNLSRHLIGQSVFTTENADWCKESSDSGASKHIFRDIKRFINSRAVSNFFVTLPTNESVRVKLIGDVVVNDSLLLRDEKKINKIIGKVDQCQGLYVLEEDKKVAINQVFAVSLDVWHQRIGHPSNRTLLVIKSLLNVKTSLQESNCTICPLSKQKRLPFVSLNNACDKSFDLVHLDTWEPFHLPDRNGHRYFLTLVDDHNRYTWVFLVKNKSDDIQVIPWFYNMVLTQFGMKIKAFRTDNAQELNFMDFFLDKGILHERSCVERPQQNLVVECKHQYLLNVARSLMFQSKEVLYDKLPDFSVLRTFGCLVFASTLTNQRHKFSPHAKACVFVCYLVGMKSYKLLDLETKEIFDSHDVFHEDVFPYDGGHVDKDYDPFAYVVIPVVGTDDFYENKRHKVRMEQIPSSENEDELGEPIFGEPMEHRAESLTTTGADCSQAENSDRRSS
ncbi:uncharacterized protein LOC112506192 [Cynara cardunculus var. scolymus]|uniref:uncharacterized protein LOC112506192 n=1 Tax=Cynara cardunculus var. scolymus TaxID=59895 RepID=UPI000D6244D7|nr:uncharacterized protein LOC112506192 [Cynara cardunculus var. scolymus]